MQRNFRVPANRQYSVPDVSANTTTPAGTGQAPTDGTPNSRGIAQAGPNARARNEQLSMLPRRRSRDEGPSRQTDQPEAQRLRVTSQPGEASVSTATAALQPRAGGGALSSSAPKPVLSMDLARKHHPALTRYRFRNQSNGGYYFGPTIHYGGKNFFVTATFLEQLPWASAHSDTVDGTLVSGRTFDNDFEKYRVRIKMGYYF